MKALIIAPQPFFSARGTPFSVYYRTLVTAECGVQVDMLTYGEGADVDIPGVRIIRIPRFSFLGNVKIGPSYLKLFLDMVLFIWFLGLIIRNRYHFVHAHEEAVFFCRFFKPLFGFKLVYDMHSSLPQQLTNFRFTDSRLVINLFKSLEETSLRAADAVITICPALAEYVNGLAIDGGKHFLIENSIFDPVNLCAGPADSRGGSSVSTDRNPMLEEGRRYVVYAGTLEPYQGIEILIHSFREVTRKDPSVFLLIVGGSRSQVEHYRTLAEECGIGNSCFLTGQVAQSVAKEIKEKASVLVSPRSDGTNTPLKIYEYLASGKPVVATDIYSHTQVLNSDICFLVKPEPQDMARGIQQALLSNGERDRIVRNAKATYEEKYSRKVYEEKIRRMLELLA